jgi:hypothetical protein
MIDHSAIQLACRARARSLSVCTTTAFSRASTATYHDVNGIVQTAAVDEYRGLHYVGATLTPLYESSAATNLLRQSEDFTTSWAEETVLAGAQGAAANTHTAPDGNVTADRFDYVTQTLAITDAGAYTLSLYVKENQATYFDIELYTKVSAAAGSKTTRIIGRFTWTAGVPVGVVQSGSGSIQTNVVLDDGWYRVGVTIDALAASDYVYVLYSGNSGLNGRLTAWGAQMESGSSMTSYIATTTAAATRAADTGGSSIAATATGYTRGTGSFLTDGFRIGMEVTPTGFTDSTKRTITAVTALALTVNGAPTVQSAATGRTLSVGLPSSQAWENVAHTPAVGTPWVSEAYVPGALARATMGSLGQLEALGLYILSVYGPTGIDTGALYGYADALVSHFAPDTPLALSTGDTTRVRGRPAPSVGQVLILDGGWAALTVTIPILTRVTNSR